MPDVLVVEDDILVADLLQGALEAGGYHVSGIARTIAEAKQSAEQHPPDFAIIDIRLANGDCGTEFLRSTAPCLGIVYSSGNSSDWELTRLDGDAVMAKPYPLRDVARGLEIITEIRRLGRTHLRFPRNFRLLDPPAS